VKLSRLAFWVMIAASVLMPFSAGAYWWSTWSERAIAEFCERMQANDLDGASALLKPPARWEQHEFDVRKSQFPWLAKRDLIELRADPLDSPLLQGERFVFKEWFQMSALRLTPRSFTDWPSASRRFSVAEGTVKFTCTRGLISIEKPDLPTLCKVAKARFETGHFAEATILAGFYPDDVTTGVILLMAAESWQLTPSTSSDAHVE
jgi:hypothetical protein